MKYTFKCYIHLKPYALKLQYICSYYSSFQYQIGRNKGEGIGIEATGPWQLNYLMPLLRKEQWLFALFFLILLLLAFSKKCI